MKKVLLSFLTLSTLSTTLLPVAQAIAAETIDNPSAAITQTTSPEITNEYVDENGLKVTAVTTVNGTDIYTKETVHLTQEYLDQLSRTPSTLAFTYNQTIYGDLGAAGLTVSALAGSLVGLMSGGTVVAVWPIAATAIEEGMNRVYYKCDVYSQRTPVTAQKRVWSFYRNSSRTSLIGRHTIVREYVLD